MVSIVPGRVMRAVVMLVLALFGFAFFFVALIWTFQERIAFQPQSPPFPSHGLTARLEYRAADGQPLFAYLVGAQPETGTRLLIAFHGNADLAVRQIEWAHEIVERTGWSVLLPEYRGYMGLPGRPGYESSRLDAAAAYAFARDSLRVSDRDMAFFGHSMGTAIAAELAERHPPVALLLQSPFTSARAMARLMGSRAMELTWTLVSRLHYDTVALVARLDTPVWVAHGDDDRLIPAGMGKAIFDSAKVKGELLMVRGAGHNDVQYNGGESYWQWISSALTSRSATAPASTPR